MSILTKPLYLFGPPMLLLVSIPLAIFASITTTIAVALLAVRVSVVYCELGVALIHAYISPEPAKPAPKRPSSLTCSPPRSRHRHGSSSSQDTAVPAARIHKKSESSASLLGISDLTRDFEGVGGWRYYEGEEEEALWMGMNKRLELPIAVPRRHQRRHTGEDRWSWSPETMRMSPVQSRSRTPTQAVMQGEGDEYFPLQMGIRPLSTASEPLSRSALQSRRPSAVGLEGSPTHAVDSKRANVAAKQSGE
ncbi:hypothetical protein P280DRAFT_526882 [Massarina eburnea CBS 473.64]|uniref:Uncharacterized protein n=1 Tax=Massarina eburnea CBS 473.64 TaxID=1395130 RepID=A0A6A6RV92_9PLEO|nr:hypothetical protein P280DRAFT_526882 [Massarina eburnea CBS 473.64]